MHLGEPWRTLVGELSKTPGQAWVGDRIIMAAAASVIPATMVIGELMLVQSPKSRKLTSSTLLDAAEASTTHPPEKTADARGLASTPWVEVLNESPSMALR